MSTDRIAQLHELASERYLNGDYNGALQAWRDVLTMDPKNEQAMDGVRMASQFAEPVAAPATVAAPDVEDELDQGLRVFDSLGAAPQDAGATMMLSRDDVSAMIDRKPAPVAASAVPDPMRQSEGIDFGDLTSVSAIPLGGAPGEAAPPPAMLPESDDADAMIDLPPIEEAASGLEPVAPGGGGASSAASAELQRRVQDLLADARAKAQAGERDEALAILSRLAILDEENAEAEALRGELQGSSASDLDRIENAIVEGVQALETDRLDDAERCFNLALELSPGHREAQHYLEKLHERRAGAGPAPGGDPHAAEDLLGPDLLASGQESPLEVPSDEAVPLATPAAAGPQAPGKSKGPRAAKPAPLPEAPVPQPRGRFAMPSPKWMIVGGLIATVAVAGVLLVPRLTGGAKKPIPVPPPRAARPAKPRPGAAGSASAAPAPALGPAEIARAVAGKLQDGRAQAAAGDFGAAVVSFNDALRLDPGNAEAKSGLDEAMSAYRSHKAEQEALESIRTAYKDGEYTAGLRLAYRLPPTVPKSFVDQLKLVGWYNLALVALRAGDCREALSHLSDALEVVPNDPDSEKLRVFADRYQSAPKDRSFLDQVEAFPFRPTPNAATSIAAR